ncbi:protein translocase subunit secA [Oceanobacillus limi]|uniref:Protein translocase subunit SecA n=1 Tax=Oceanobacillus limi TaxID=930131 RepID=A0A1I0A320_9BACI|nr:accessory Sec system translocase SecA2 [Oceanobacillus limi]SES88498.1 protein translocase subunit secA [Oceanobacillus limi]
MNKQKASQHPKRIRALKPYMKLINKINTLEKQFEQYSDEELKQKTEEFKQRLEQGETIHDLTVEAFATVREASKRVLGLRHYDIQLLGGLVLVKGNIAEMKTGEGKTLVASLPGYLYALEGKGAHIITVNEYLAKRDKELIGQIHEFLGLTVGLNIAQLSNSQKKEAYNCDITYGVGTEFGFDYLRDNMVSSPEEKVQRPYHFAIIDEVDSVLIDEARTPLIIAGKDQPSSRLYKVCSMAVKNLKQDEDYTLDQELKTVNFTESGITKCEKVFGISNLFDLEHSSLFHALLQALRARTIYHRDVDYIVDDGEVKLIDMNTGRIMEGRSLSDGLHQAIEAKEGLRNTDENKTHASVTIQNYYQMYQTLSGMTGTAKTEETELRTVYGMDVIQIPPNKPNQRIDHSDIVFMKKEQKYNYLIEDIKKRHATGQPILIGTSSIIKSEEIAEILDKEGIEYQLLNAKSAEKEAQLVALAGQKGKITIATNMAGRGTDIMLGEGVAELGGLHVIGTERNESQRIDNQLKGRSGRQGDPGSTQFIISLEDYLFVRYAEEELERIHPKLKFDKTGFITSNNVHKFVDTAQKISEGIHYQIREYNLKLENVLNKQREVVYQFRDSVFDTNIIDFVVKQTKSIPAEIILSFFGNEESPELMDVQVLQEELNKVLLSSFSFGEETFETVEEIQDYVDPYVKEHIDALRSFKDDKEILSLSKSLTLSVVDRLWKAHLDTMHQLKEGIGMRQYQQEDPIQIFEKEGYTLFESFFAEIKYEMALRITQTIKQLTKQRNK